MKNINFNFLLILLDKLPQILSLVGLISLFWFIFYAKNIHKQIGKKEAEIFKVKKEIDDMLMTVHNQRRGYVNQSQLEAITENNRLPLRAELETLNMERQFLLDKINILGMLKK